MNMWLKIKVALLIFFYQRVGGTEKLDECTYILHTSERENIVEHDRESSKCKTESVARCQKSYNISYLRISPYSDETRQIIDMISRCCGRCTEIREINTFSDFEKVNSSSIMTSDFVFPIIGPATANRLYGYYFVSMYDTQGALFITEREGMNLTKFVKACWKVWPLFACCLFLALISGFISWVVETWSNRKQFPPSFFMGWFEGFYWSFISMTTVGYGDVTPKTIPGRIYSILWILVGIVIFSLVTASLSKSINDVTSVSNVSLKDKAIGILNDRMYETYLVSMQGGQLHMSESTKGDVGAISELISKLKGREIHGILIDKYTFWWYLSMRVGNYSSEHLEYSETSKISEIVHFLKRKSVTTEVGENVRDLSYGMLIKNYSDYKYFRRYIIDNKLARQSELLFSLKDDSEGEYVSSIFNPIGHQEKKITLGLASVIGLIFLYGIIYEMLRRKMNIFRYNVGYAVDNAT